MIKVGALWAKKDKNGKSMMSGLLEMEEGKKQRVLLFKNGYKKEEKQPDYYLFLADEQQEQKPKPEPEIEPVPLPVVEPEPDQKPEPQDDDIPF